MATYKVIQDIEADDKLLGPLSLRQFVYAGITVFCGYLSYMAVAKGAPFLLIVFIPPAIIAAFFAFPWGKEQSTEIWALARIRFLFKPRKRIWDQTGIKELVTITAPKTIERIYTDGLSQTEVRSRLQTLAATIDSRGWAIKNTTISPYTPTPVFAGAGSLQNNDRLIDINALPRETPVDETTPSEDILDAGNNPKAHQFDTMLATNAHENRERLIASMQQAVPAAAPPPPPAFETQAPPITQNQPVATSDSNDDQTIIDTLRNNKQQQSMQYSHLPTIQPLSAQQAQTTPAPSDVMSDPIPDTPVQRVTPEPDTVILNLAHSNDLSISTLAREARKEHGEEPQEVVIPLH
jgi:hypothetical protein